MDDDDTAAALVVCRTAWGCVRSMYLCAVALALPGLPRLQICCVAVARACLFSSTAWACSSQTLAPDFKSLLLLLLLLLLPNTCVLQDSLGLQPGINTAALHRPLCPVFRKLGNFPEKNIKSNKTCCTVALQDNLGLQPDFIQLHFTGHTLLAGAAAEQRLAASWPHLVGSGTVINLGEMTLSNLPVGMLQEQQQQQ
jgi:hypothetical protein